MAGETHFLFGDDRFGPWGAEFERAAARDGLQPQDPVTVGQIRGWIDAMRPELGLRDEVADLIVLAWAALRQRAWYQHGASDPGAAARHGPARTWSCGPSRCPCRPTGRRRRRAPRSLFGIRVNPYLTAAGRRRVHREPPRRTLDTLADPAAAPGRRGWSSPTSTSACR